MSKLLEFESFRIQLAQSPLLSAFAGVVAVAVPAAELFISLLLSFTRTRFAGLLLSFALMVMFTVYILIILNWTSFIPCSCGGILERLGWTEHLIFNLFFILLSLSCLLLYRKEKLSEASAATGLLYTSGFFGMLLSGIAIVSSFLVIVLYLLSEDIIHRNNAFMRRYPQHPVNLIKGRSITYNSYYLAGVSQGKIFLGNTTAPLHLLESDTSLTQLRTVQLQLDVPEDKPYSSFRIRIADSVFYLTDPTVPAL